MTRQMHTLAETAATDASLSARERRLTAALDAVGNARVTRALDGAFATPQPSWSRLTGQSAVELAGWGWLDAVHPDDRAATRAQWRDAAAASLKVGYRLRDPAGKWRQVLERAARFDGADGLPPEAIGVIEDASTLRDTEQRLRLALDGGRMGTWDIDLATGVMQCSSQCKLNYGRDPADDFTYAALAAAVYPDDFARWQAEVAGAVERGGEFGIDYRTTWPDGTLHWVYVRGSCTLDGAGRATTLSGVSIDVTERKRAHALEQERAARAALDSERKTAFLAILAHELRGPLAPIRYALHALRTLGADAQQRERLRVLAERQVGHMALVVDDLLDVARIERGEIRLRLQRVELREAVQVAVDACAPLMASRTQTFQQTGMEQALPVLGDPTRIAQMVTNLLNNAAKYTPTGGAITLELGRQQGAARICVVDNGVGLDPAALETVFDMFAQVADQKPQAQGGLGIGLALTRQLAELHGGAVTAYSEGIGRGCRFSITLPLADAGA